MATSTPSGERAADHKTGVHPGIAAEGPVAGVELDEQILRQPEKETKTAVASGNAPNPAETAAVPARERVSLGENFRRTFEYFRTVTQKKSKKQKRLKQHRQKTRKDRIKRVKRGKRTHAGKAPGILSLVFGILGLLIGWTAVWFIGLLFALMAIIFGAIAIGSDRGRGMGIAGLILGILTIIVPVLLIALILATLS